MREAQLHVGIDVGGTNLKAGLVDGQGSLLAVKRIPLAFQGAEAFAATLAELAGDVLKLGGAAPEQLEDVGIGLPGAVDGGEVCFTTNIPLEHVPLERLFRGYLDRPVFLGNDADCAAAGEFFCGAGCGTKDFVMITLGTGIGAGVILGGRLRGGPCSSEAGHLVMMHGGDPCNCGRQGCWERYASATGLIAMTQAAMAAHPESTLCRTALEAVEGRTAFEAALAGDPTAQAVCHQYVEYLADGIASLINILRPEVLAIGGGVSAAPKELLLEPLCLAVERESFFRHGGRKTRLLQAELGNDAGIIGAALLGQITE